MVIFLFNGNEMEENLNSVQTANFSFLYCLYHLSPFDST
jgi:hypothetical protein